MKRKLPEPDHRSKILILWLSLPILVIGTFFLGLAIISKNQLIQNLLKTNLRHLRTSYEVFGFAPWWMIDKMDNIDWKVLTTFAYFSLPVGADGAINRDSREWQVFEGQKLTTLWAVAKMHQVKRILTLTQMSDLTIEAFLNDPFAWNNLAKESVELIKSKNLDGANIDFEYVGTNENIKKNFANFVDTYVRILRENLKNPYITVSVLASSVRFDQIYDISYLAKITDGVFMMAYDFYYPGSVTIGPAAPLYGFDDGHGPFWYDVSTAVEDFLKVAPAEKIILGVAHYGWNYAVFEPSLKTPRDLRQEAQAVTIDNASTNKIIETTPVGGWDDRAKVSWRSWWDSGGWHVVYLEDKRSLSYKYALVKSKKLAGVGIWALGYGEDDDSLWTALEESFGNQVVSLTNNRWQFF